MLDLVISSRFHDHYTDLKKELNTPRFEVGLSFTYFDPATVLLRLKGGISVSEIYSSFKKVVPKFREVVKKFCENREISWDDFQKSSLDDKWINSGLFGALYTKTLLGTTEGYYEETKDKRGLVVYKRIED